ncbi:MAG: folate-binding protein YgfZ [Acidimicrobiaceae bacterium]|jgi:folate-binding protein YgfZ|nr:folate-binding protein YgfZ [Acidimicrobiaceae bacterium]
MTIDVRTTLAVIAGQRQAVIAEGPDALKFLQGQLSQDLDALAPGEAGWSLLLHPQGKISAWFRITRVTNDRFVIDVDAGWADEVLTRLNRFKLRTDIDISLAPWESLTIVGPGADESQLGGVEHDMITSWAGVAVRDVFGPALGGASVDAPELSAEQFTALRIEAGVPKMGSELDESTIPAAAGIVEQSVSFTKGCYTGQELVARIDSRGNNVPKRLLSVVFAGDVVPSAEAAVMAGDAAIGSITSASYSEQLGAAVGLAYISRAGEVGQSVTTYVSGVPVTGELRELPLVRG